jgi:4-amino-4-deoxy-L-arabinose transferase-like glycosyltransferase
LPVGGARVRNIILIVFLLTAFALRLYRLDHQEIWGDEAHSAYVSRLALLSVVSPSTETNPPLYHLLLYFWVRLTGSSVFALRFLSLVLGALTVPLVYRLTRLSFGEPVGLLAAILCAISPFQVYYSQEARMYALATFSTTLSMFLFARIVSSRRGQPSRQGLWVYFLATAAAIFTHYCALFVVVAQNVVLLGLWWRERGRLRRWLAVQAVLALLYLPWVLAQRGFLSGKASARFDELTLPVLITIIKRSLVAFSVGTMVQMPLGGYLTLVFLLLVTLGLVATVTIQTSDETPPPGRGRLGGGGFSVEGSPSPSPSLGGRGTLAHPPRRGRQGGGGDGDRWQPWLLLAWLLIPLAFAWLVNPIMPFFQERYLLVIAPAFAILAAQGLEWVGGRSPWALALGLLFVISTSSFSLHNWFFDGAYTKGEYKLMMDYVRGHAQEGDLLLLNNPLQEALLNYYRPLGVPHHLLSRHDLHTEDRADQALAALTKGYSRVWLVMFGYAEQYDPNHLAERWLSAHGYRSSYRSFLGAYLTLYVMSPADASASMQYQYTVAANLGNEALLIGYGLSAQKIKAGETLGLTLYWQALAEMEKRYTVFTHLLDAENRIVAQMDSEPLGGIHPTTEWQFGEIVRDNYGLAIAPDTLPGEYLLEVGMYYLPTLERLPVLHDSGNVQDDRVVLRRIVVY